MSVQRERSWPFMTAMRLPGGSRATLPGVNSRGNLSLFFLLRLSLMPWCSRARPLLTSRLQIGSPFRPLLAAEFVQIIPAEETGVVAVVEVDAHGVVSDRIEGRDLDVFLAGDDFLRLRPVALDFGARRFDAEIFRGQDELLAAVEHDGEAQFVGAEAKLGRPRTRRSAAHRASRSASLSSRASPASMIGMPSRMG